MNLDLDPDLRRRASALRVAAGRAPLETAGYHLLDEVGAFGLTSDGRVRQPTLLEWCVLTEELGGARRDIAQMQAVRLFAEAFLARDRPQRDLAERAFRWWVAWHRPNTGHNDELASFGRHGGATVDTTSSSFLPVAELGSVAWSPQQAADTSDRDLLVGAAYAVGLGRACLETSQHRAGERTVGGRKLIEHQGPAHRLATAALGLADARVGLWRAAAGEDNGVRSGYRAPAAAAAAIEAAVDCAQELVQVFGAAGTHDRDVTGLYRAAYGLTALIGPPATLWDIAGRRWTQDGSMDGQRAA